MGVGVGFHQSKNEMAIDTKAVNYPELHRRKIKFQTDDKINMQLMGSTFTPGCQQINTIQNTIPAEGEDFLRQRAPGIPKVELDREDGGGNRKVGGHISRVTFSV